LVADSDESNYDSAYEPSKSRNFRTLEIPEEEYVDESLDIYPSVDSEDVIVDDRTARIYAQQEVAEISSFDSDEDDSDEDDYDLESEEE